MHRHTANLLLFVNGQPEKAVRKLLRICAAALQPLQSCCSAVALALILFNSALRMCTHTHTGRGHSLVHRYTHTYTHIYTRTHTHVHTHTYTHTYTHTGRGHSLVHTYTHTYTHVHTNVHTRTHAHRQRPQPRHEQTRQPLCGSSSRTNCQSRWGAACSKCVLYVDCFASSV
jgi:hypothetical protein